MRVLYVIQRYGPDVRGGAELHCRLLAERLVERGHDVSVLTTRAAGYLDWANTYPAGHSAINGVDVHRLGVRNERNSALFGEVDARVPWGLNPPSYHMQRLWMHMQGPDVPELAPWLTSKAGDFDVAVFFTYLYNTTYCGLPAAARRAPTILHPTAHHEPQFYLPIVAALLRHPRAFAFSTPEERSLVERRARIRQRSDVIGIGTDLDVTGNDSVPRREYGIGDRAYLLYIGRVDTSKGTPELLEMFRRMRAHDRPALVVAGEAHHEIPDDPDIIAIGSVDDETKHNLLAGCTALVQPSHFESFSMVLTEAWAHAKPVIAQGRTDVLLGQLRRSGGGIPYLDAADFDAAVGLVGDPEIARRLGSAGRSYVEAEYGWDTVMDRYEALLASTRLTRHSGD